MIVDEIQKVPDLLDEVHWLLENTSTRFVLTPRWRLRLQCLEGISTSLSWRSLGGEPYAFMTCGAFGKSLIHSLLCIRLLMNRLAMQFIDREKELAALEKAWQGDKAQLLMIYGKRQVGKTELIKQFIEDKSHVYFLGQRVNDIDNRRWLNWRPITSRTVSRRLRASPTGAPCSNMAETGSGRGPSWLSTSSLI